MMCIWAITCSTISQLLKWKILEAGILLCSYAVFSVLSPSGEIGNSPNHFRNALISSQKKMETSSLVKIYLMITKEQQGQMGAESCLMTRSILSKLTMPTSQWKQGCLPYSLWDTHLFCMFLPQNVWSYRLQFKKTCFSSLYLKI